MEALKVGSRCSAATAARVRTGSTKSPSRLALRWCCSTLAPPTADGAGDPPAPGAVPPDPEPELEHEATMARQRAPAAVLAMGRDLPGFIAGDYRASRARLE